MKTKTNTFEVSSGKVTFGDPCYDSNKTVRAKKGPWTAHVQKKDEGSWGHRVSRAIVHHVEFNPADRDLTSRRFNFSVDSGQAGVFDGGLYGTRSGVLQETFYDMCCKATLSKKSCGYVDGGFATSSGFGDGFYSAEVQYLDGEAVCVELTFIEE